MIMIMIMIMIIIVLIIIIIIYVPFYAEGAQGRLLHKRLGIGALEAHDHRHLAQ
jgi:hypothetical protein